MKSSGNIHVEREGDRVVVRSQWGNSLVGSICLGLLYIAGVIVIYLLNGEITDNLPSPVVTAGLILVGVYIMLPRRLTATFDSQERRSIRVYNFFVRPDARASASITASSCDASIISDRRVSAGRLPRRWHQWICHRPRRRSLCVQSSKMEQAAPLCHL